MQNEMVRVLRKPSWVEALEGQKVMRQERQGRISGPGRSSDADLQGNDAIPRRAELAFVYSPLFMLQPLSDGKKRLQSERADLVDRERFVCGRCLRQIFSRSSITL
jgi:hypothetical protein